MSDRNRPLEHDLLERAGGLPTFTDQVLARLDQVEAKHGNIGWDQAVDQLLAEMQEEAADIAGWAMGAALQLSEDHRRRLYPILVLAATGHRLIEDLRLDLVLGPPG